MTDEQEQQRAKDYLLHLLAIYPGVQPKVERIDVGPVLTTFYCDRFDDECTVYRCATESYHREDWQAVATYNAGELKGANAGVGIQSSPWPFGD